jgi:hypothetical protein
MEMRGSVITRQDQFILSKAFHPRLTTRPRVFTALLSFWEKSSCAAYTNAHRPQTVYIHMPDRLFYWTAGTS